MMDLRGLAWLMAIGVHILVAAVLLVALVLAVARWQRHPRVSLFALIGAGLGLAQCALAGAVLSSRLRGGFWPPFFDRVLMLPAYMVSPVSWGFMVAAVFCRREMTVPEALARHFEQEAKAAAERALE